MRISQINILKNQNLNPNRNNPRSFSINFKGIDDSFQSSLKDIKPSKGFLSVVEDKNQQEKIIRELLLDDKGNYDSKMERLFVRTVKSVDKQFKENGLQVDDTYSSALAESSMEVLKFLKNNESEIEIVQDDINSLVGYSTTLLLKGINKKNVQRLYDISFENGQLDTKKALYLSLYMAERNIETSPDRAYSDIKKCFSDESNVESGITYILKLATVLNFALAFSKEDTKFITKLVSDNDSELDNDKCQFVCEVLNLLYSSVETDATDLDIAVEELLQYKEPVYKILEIIIQKASNKSGEFDIDIAREMFNDWYDYAENNSDYFNENCHIPIHINSDDSYRNLSFKELSKYIQSDQFDFSYNNLIYRLFYLLNVENPENSYN